MDTSTLEGNLNDNKQKKINIKNSLYKVSNFIKKWKYLVRIALSLAIITTIWMLFFIMKTINDTKELNAKSEQLYNLTNYNISTISSNSLFNNEAKELKKINDLIDYNINLQETTKKYNEYLEGIQASYENFLKYLFLPSLNIWKNEFLGIIYDDYIWEKFIENNPYNDIDLIDKRSNFIKDVWSNNEYNEIDQIEIWEINEEWDNFYIPIKISYRSNSYRSFLLLIEKLSMTSNQKSISLINELIYNIWEIIKKDKNEDILKIQQIYPEFSEDKIIWYNLYERIKQDSNDSLIDDEIIRKAIKEIAQCENESEEYCYYKFRNKYRNIPSLAYTIWINWNDDYTEELKNFLQGMPQIIKIVNFTYDWEKEVTDLTNHKTKQYVWTVEFRIYWKWINNDEVLEIQKTLWEKCIWNNLTPEAALEKIEYNISNLWSNTNIDTYSTIRLMEIKALITNISNIYKDLGNYKKVIKTFEIYRMLKEWNVCNL